VKSFVALAKSKPEGLRFASSGGGSAQHLAAARFMLATGTQMIHVPYKGSGAAIVDLLAGHVELNFESPPNVLPHWQSGKLRVLAITSNKRSPLLPDVPTLAEAGVKGAEVYSWQGLAAPKGLPPAVKDKLSAAAIAAMNDPEVKKRMVEQGLEIVASTPAEFTAFQAREWTRWKTLIETRKITAD
jgi:tripartite-type tricarboxylate transporter receptor subunit TctC